MTTKRLYYSDSYLQSFQARVQEVSPDRTRLYLDGTAFYPTSGGQAFDVGVLGESAVVDVIDEGERIAHVLAEPAEAAVEPGAVLEGRIDWQRRFDHMQQHTGQHLLSAVLQESFGWTTVSVHFGARTSSLDLDVQSVSPEAIAEAERQANAIVFQNRPVTLAYEDASTATGLRKASDRAGTLRIVSIEGLDRAACGGTHVRATGEIGVILLRAVERVRKAVRLEFVCGGRAVSQAREDFEALSRIARSFSTSMDKAPALVEAQAEQARQAASERKRLHQELARARAQALWNATAPDAAGVRWIAPEGLPTEPEEVRALAHAIAALPGALLIASLDDPPTVLLAASPDSGVNAGSALRQALATVGGRGGGSPQIAQGSTPDAASAAAAVQILRKSLASRG